MLVENFNVLVKDDILVSGDILIYLNLFDRPLSIEELANKIGESTRNIQRRLKRLIIAKLITKDFLTGIWRAIEWTDLSNTNKQSKLLDIHKESKQNNQGIDKIVAPLEINLPEAHRYPEYDNEKNVVLPEVYEAAKKLYIADKDLSFLNDQVKLIVGAEVTIAELFEQAVAITAQEIQDRTEGLNDVRNPVAFFIGVLRNVYKNYRNREILRQVKPIERFEPDVVETKEFLKEELVSMNLKFFPANWDKQICKVIDIWKKDGIPPIIVKDAIIDRVMAASMQTYWAGRLVNSPEQLKVLLNEYQVRWYDSNKQTWSRSQNRYPLDYKSSKAC